MDNISYLTLEQVLAIHQNQIDTYGGKDGIRDLALLESAIFRPQTTFSGRDLYSSLFEKAASLMHSLILNHPFLDGNKRTGVVAIIIFLQINGYLLDIKQEKLINFALDVESKKLGVEQISSFLESNSKKL